MEWRENRVLCILLFIFLYSQGIGQDGVKQEVDSVWWKNKTEQIDYTEDAIEFKNINPNDYYLKWFNGPVVMYIVLFLIIIVLVYILYRLFAKELWSTTKEVDIREFKLLKEEDLDDRFYEMDLDQLVQNAVLKQDWKMAIRIQFLILLKILIDRKQIKWHKDLTNFQIVNQLKIRDNRKKMQTIVAEFERVWYGNQASKQDVYTAFQHKVNHFIESINLKK